MWASLGAVPFEAERCPLGDEGTAYEARWTWWPPGATRCTYTSADGEVSESTYVPWQEWATVAVCALGVALAAFALLTMRLWPAYAAVVLLAGGLAIWFVGLTPV